MVLAFFSGTCYERFLRVAFVDKRYLVIVEHKICYTDFLMASTTEE
jgi:hypothetical protein